MENIKYTFKCCYIKAPGAAVLRATDVYIVYQDDSRSYVVSIADLQGPRQDIQHFFRLCVSNVKEITILDHNYRGVAISSPSIIFPGYINNSILSHSRRNVMLKTYSKVSELAIWASSLFKFKLGKFIIRLGLEKAGKFYGLYRSRYVCSLGLGRIASITRVKTNDEKT